MTPRKRHPRRPENPVRIHYRPKQELETFCGIKNAINHNWPAPASDDIFTHVAREVTCFSCYEHIERRGIVDEPWAPKQGWSYFFKNPRRS